MMLLSVFAARSSLKALPTLARGGSLIASRGMASAAGAPVEDRTGGKLSETYSKALFEAGTKGKAFEAVVNDVSTIQKYRQESVAFREFLDNPTISRSFKAKILSGTVAPKLELSSVMKEFLTVTADNGRANELGPILATFLKNYTTSGASAKGMVTAAEPLTPWQKASLEKQLVQRFFPDGSKSSLDLEFKLDTTLLGGYTAEIDERFIDMSLRNEALQVDDIVKTS
ncbi:hypothetical protein NDN08_001994 [Rhodosorus marinus]|uniref:ATP synthase subunit O, mitochondrial n=1 Tax=Rhodosorus marinus TaxID=101924 RepID=A0AAV8UWT8_9RHOD|nr:hypothetical protein NDN08_001994 [Rhodosorus marinus]